MRSRTVREGSVGLLFLLGIGLFGALFLWLRGTYFGDRTYKAIVEFANAAGMQIGTPVRYRGVAVGKVTNIKAGANGVEVEIEITQPDLAIPRDVTVEANQSGLISENTIDIIPTNSVPINLQGANPLDPNCKDSNLIICNNARLQGQVGISLDEFIRVAVRFAKVYSDTKFFDNINSAVENTSVAAQGITQVTRELSALLGSVKQDLRNVSAAANAVNQTANKFGGTADRLNQTIVGFGGTAGKVNQTIDKFGGTADRLNQTIAQFGGTAVKLNQTADKFAITANQINGTVNQTANRFGVTADKFGRVADRVSVTVDRLDSTATRTANKFGTTADELRLTATQASGLVTNLNNLITANQATLVNTLNNLSQTSEQLRVTVANLAPAIDRLTQGELIRNLETLSANAAQASANLRDVSNSLNSPTNLLVLQQTLDSARVTFQNAQKITSDLDELTGDPAFRNNLRNLVNGLSGLVSSTEQLQQQVEVAQFLTPMAEATNMQIPEITGHINSASANHSPIPLPSPIAENKLNKSRNRR